MYVEVFWWGTTLAFVGAFTPGMINLSALQLTVLRGTPAGVSFAMGAALVDVLKAFIGLLGATFLLKIPYFQLITSCLSIPLLGYIAYRFWISHKTEEMPLFNGKNYFWMGATASGINFLSIPYWISCVFLISGEKYNFQNAEILGVVNLGVAFGSVVALMGYVLAAYFFKQQLFKYTSVINKLASVILVGTIVFIIKKMF